MLHNLNTKNTDGFFISQYLHKIVNKITNYNTTVQLSDEKSRTRIVLTTTEYTCFTDRAFMVFLFNSMHNLVFSI